METYVLGALSYLYDHGNRSLRGAGKRPKMAEQKD